MTKAKRREAAGKRRKELIVWESGHTISHRIVGGEDLQQMFWSHMVPAWEWRGFQACRGF